MEGTSAVYGLTGDPITFGHLRVIDYGVANFGTLHIIVAENAQKKPVFNVSERTLMIQEATRHLPRVRVSVLPHGKLLVRHAASLGAKTLLRGIRNGMDHEYERMMSDFNEMVEPSVRTVCINAKPGELYVSSSFVKSLVGLEDWRTYVSKLVPLCVLPYLEKWSEVHHAGGRTTQNT